MYFNYLSRLELFCQHPNHHHLKFLPIVALVTVLRLCCVVYGNLFDCEIAYHLPQACKVCVQISHKLPGTILTCRFIVETYPLRNSECASSADCPDLASLPFLFPLFFPPSFLISHHKNAPADLSSILPASSMSTLLNVDAHGPPRFLYSSLLSTWTPAPRNIVNNSGTTALIPTLSRVRLMRQVCFLLPAPGCLVKGDFCGWWHNVVPRSRRLRESVAGALTSRTGLNRIK